MRTRLGLSLALLALAALPAAASAERVEHRPTAASHPLDSSSIIATQEYPMSTSTSGNAIQVTDHLDKYVSQFGGSGVHHVAASAARAAVAEITKVEPEGATFSISISETVSESSGSLSVQYNITRAPQPAAPAAAPAPAPSTSTASTASPTGAPGSTGSADGTGAGSPT
jgi:hypothetical protein